MCLLNKQYITYQASAPKSDLFQYKGREDDIGFEPGENTKKLVTILVFVLASHSVWAGPADWHSCIGKDLKSDRIQQPKMNTFEFGINDYSISLSGNFLEHENLIYGDPNCGKSEDSKTGIVSIRQYFDYGPSRRSVDSKRAN